MRSVRATFRASYAAAFLAVVLLAYAGVRSSVMQAGTAASSAILPADCPMGMAMDGMSMPMDLGQKPAGATAPGKAHVVCNFCVVASQAPLPSIAPVVHIPTSIAWRSSAPREGHSPRGPPRITPRARGPPVSPLIA